MNGPLVLLWLLACYLATVALCFALPRVYTPHLGPGIENLPFAAAAFSIFVLWISRTYTGLLRIAAPGTLWIKIYDSLLLPVLVFVVALLADASIRGPVRFEGWPATAWFSAVLWFVLVVDPKGLMGRGILASDYFQRQLERTAATGNSWQLTRRYPPTAVSDVIIPFALVNIGLLLAITVISRMGRNS